MDYLIEPISCELGDNMKAHIEMLELIKTEFNKYTIKVFMISKQMHGNKIIK